ncbi:uncharacterized protein LOC126849813 isoform X2 [Cataglyphis hispanica]|uniref:uncharacterized protein LOC126849813 isoform X2 n=1 Tax=Cataglyphis hispanica TaxID=1086592 RepID=UPI00217F659A|nr:uncharacterized protein LOC126849813 isoform X2 [Cataglyphis hispanica]
MDGETPRPVTLISSPQTTAVVCNLLTATTPRLTPTGKISHAKTRVYTQRYRKEWEQMQDFKGWLTSVPHQPTRAYCIYCKKNLHAHRLSLLKHTCTMKHQRAALAHKMEEKKSSRKWDANALEIGLIEEVEAVDDSRTGDEENEEDIEYIVERLETDEEEATEMQEVKEETEEIIDDEEEGEKEIVSDLYTQLQSDDEDKPVIKKIKLSNQKCRDTLAEAMAHVHSEYLEEEIEDQGNVQMEMVVESANPDVSDADNTKETLKEILENESTEIKADKKSTVKENNKSDLNMTPSLPVLNTSYQTNIISSTPNQNTINFLPIVPNLKNNKTITLMCGNKTFTLTGGTFQPGTQYVLTKLKGKPLMMADTNKTIAVSEPDKIKTSNLSSSAASPSLPIIPSTSQQPISTNQQPISTNQQSNAASIKGPSSKKVYLGKQPVKSTTTKKLRISTYVVDNTKGIPIGGLQVSLYKLMDGKWTFLNESNTNAEGYCVDLVEKVNCTIGRYKIHFDVDKYFTLRRIETMFPFVEIVFDVKNPNGHYHMPLLLSPFSYSTYRGT